MSATGMPELSLANCRVVTPEEVLPGGLVLREGVIAEITDGATSTAAVDCEGDYLIPGLIELHTDHLEAHFKPRPKVFWPVEAAVVAHDAQIAASGITTVFDALRVGTTKDDDVSIGSNMRRLAEALGRAKTAGVLRADHLLHLRCELACEDTVTETEAFLGDPNLRLISLMDHTPGQRQFTRMDKFKEYYGGKTGMSEAELEAYIGERQAAHAALAAPNRRRVVALAQSHDNSACKPRNSATRLRMLLRLRSLRSVRRARLSWPSMSSWYLTSSSTISGSRRTSLSCIFVSSISVICAMLSRPANTRAASICTSLYVYVVLSRTSINSNSASSMRFAIATS